MTSTRLQPWWAELPLISVTIAVTIGFIRVYDSWDFLVPLLAFGLGAHATAVACRRLRAPAALTVGAGRDRRRGGHRADPLPGDHVPRAADRAPPGKPPATPCPRPGSSTPW